MGRRVNQIQQGQGHLSPNRGDLAMGRRVIWTYLIIFDYQYTYNNARLNDSTAHV
jgi:hypothetical protein